MIDEEIGRLAKVVSDELDASVYLYSGGIDGQGYSELVRSMQANDRQPYKQNSLLILTTNGGLANSAFQIARLLQTTSAKFSLYVPRRCKSAGTLLALGAAELYMSDVSELGPLDVQLLKPNEIGERKSGLVVRTAFDGLSDECCQLFDKIMMSIKSQGATISFDRASAIATEIVTGVMAPVYGQINPDVLGSDLRNLRVATEYGNRLAESASNAKADAVVRLVSDYPSHDFIIDAHEARSLFKSVLRPTKAMYELVAKIGRPAYSEQAQHLVYRADLLPVQSAQEDALNDQAQKTDASGSSAGLDAVRGADRSGNGTVATRPSRRGPVRKAKKSVRQVPRPPE